MSSTDRYRRPAEAQLPTAIGDLRQDLLAGFDTRRAVLFFLQELSVATLGEISQSKIVKFSNEFRPDSRYDEGVLLASFLTSEPRTRDITDHVAKRTRQQWAAEVLSPASSAAMRSLRADAVEYTGEESKTEGEAIDEEIPHQRPALKELHQHQNKTLTRVLGDGLDDRADILDWGDDLLLATRSEPVADGTDPGEYVRRLHNDPSGDRIMCSTDPAWVYHRQLWVCRNLLPAFNRAVRDLAGKSTEEAGDSNTQSKDYRSV
jgi:hypothetical protein